MIKKLIICGFVFFLLTSMVTISKESDGGFSRSKGITLYVGGTGEGNYSTIQSAYNDASNGDTIYVYNGTYYEKLTIEKSIDLIGENKYTTILDGESDWDTILLINTLNFNISGFTITNSGKNGILISHENNLHIFDNIFKNNFLRGIVSFESTNIFIENNTFINDGMKITIDEIEDWDSYSIQNNTVNGKPLRFYHSMNNFTVPLDTGAVIIGNCTNVTIHQLNLTHSSMGIIISFSSNITITSNTILYNGCSGIYIEISSDVHIHQNTLSHNLIGLYLYRELNRIFIDNNTIQSSNDTGICMEAIFEHDSTIYITNNTINNNPDGICFYTLVWCHVYIKNNIINANNDGIYLGYMAANAMVIGNIITNNYRGIVTDASSNGNCYHNDLFGNNINVFDIGGYLGDWDNGYPIGGNYWDDYTGFDLYHGVNQDILGGDGIGDTPYEVIGDYIDYYPLMHPFGLITELPYGWSFFSLPTNISINFSDIIVLHNDNFLTFQEAVDEGIISPFLFMWDRLLQRYDFTNDIIPGYGYWIYTFEDCSLWTFNYERNFDDYISTLEPGWNVVGTEFDYPISKYDTLINNYTWTDAVGLGIISDVLFGWDKMAQSYTFEDSFEPGEACWMYAYQECVLKRQM